MRYMDLPNCRKSKFMLLGVLGLMLIAPKSVAAQDSPAGAVPSFSAVRRSSPISIDGTLDEDAWQLASPASGFIQREPIEGAPAEEQTEVRVLFDEDAIYFGVTLYESDPSLIGDQLVRRDGWGAFDYFELSLDPNNDQRTGYGFRVSAAGVQGDLYLFDDTDEDDAWDAVWESAVTVTADGWVAEFRIPLNQIRFEAADTVQSWGVNFHRRRLASNELTFFALESRSRHGRVSQFGRLEGLLLPDAPRRIEARPYVLAEARTAPATLGDPFFDGVSSGSRFGSDLRIGLTANFSVDLTVNPDFGQVEVDPAVINLSAFETFFPEKRPFFVEDASLYSFSRVRLFNSRRIGREPRGSAPGTAHFQDVPHQTRILGAAKLTGRTSSGLTVGAVAALTAEESGSAFDTTTGLISKFVAEPQTEYGAVRLIKDFRGGATQVGALLTALTRQLPGDGSFDYLPSFSGSVGFDFEHNWGGERLRDWVLWGFFAGSNVQGSTTAIERIQRASNHYYQRPDATRYVLDPNLTSIGGYNWRLQFERRSAEHWTGALWAAEVSGGFEVNDLGYWTSGERLDGGARISYREIDPGPVLRNYRFSLSTFHNWRHDALDDVFSFSSWSDTHKRGSLSLNANSEFLNYWELDLDVRISPTSTSDVATRGGPLMEAPGSVNLSLSGNTDRRKDLVLEAGLNFGSSAAGEREFGAGLEVSYRPSPSWEIEISPDYSRESVAAQFVGASGDVGFAPTFGRSYIFSDLERHSFSVETRVDAVFSPTLSLQLYAQPLLSSGDFTTYKRLARAESFEFDLFAEGSAVIDPMSGQVSCMGGRSCVSDGRRYLDFEGDGFSDMSFSDRDFNVRSLRMNLVLRWEYRPGSSLFVVWQQRR
ncbi:MAG: carbohydrate binding family 9 domain-containing protein, partial [Gemmatimonadota bacterium]|nr:carbohydrate binding family 9 domain-containing protein [Gemmatimonadota bacterium]